ADDMGRARSARPLVARIDLGRRDLRCSRDLLGGLEQVPVSLWGHVKVFAERAAGVGDALGDDIDAVPLDLLMRDIGRGIAKYINLFHRDARSFLAVRAPDPSLPGIGRLPAARQIRSAAGPQTRSPPPNWTGSCCVRP